MPNLILHPKNHIYTLDNRYLPGVGVILKETGFNFTHFVRRDVLEAARKFGSFLHKACYLWDKKDLYMDTLDDSLKPYIDGWIKFRKHFKVWDNEKSIYSKRWWFAGTPDRTGLFLKTPTLLDIKTDNEFTPAVTLQTAGYLIAHNEMYPKKKIHKRLVVILSAKGYRLEHHNEASDLEAFIGCVQVYNHKKKHNLLRR